jgi:hypothetical protein
VEKSEEKLKHNDEHFGELLLTFVFHFYAFLFN